jgi:hypothetical protein
MPPDQSLSFNATSILDSVTLDGFRRWQNSYRKTMEKLGLRQQFQNLVELGCDQDDLEWLLFWVAREQDRAQIPWESAKSFFRTLNDVIALNEQLAKKVELLLAFTTNDGAPVLELFYDAFGSSSRGWRIRQIPGSLDALQVELELLRFASGGRHSRFTDAALATQAEILLVAYVKEAAGKKIGFKCGPLLEAGCDAYGIEGREYDEDAMLRRHNRFRQAFPEDTAHIESIAKLYVATEFLPGNMGLIPFFVDSRIKRLRKARLQEVTSYCESQMSPSRK